MFKTNIKLAFRSLIKEKGFTLINTLGLALGLACFLLIMVYVMHEHSYEQFNPEHQKTFRLYQKGDLQPNSENYLTGFHPFGMSQYIIETFPEVEKVATVGNTGGLVVSYGDVGFQDWRGLIADTTFFDMFPTVFIQGIAKNALAGANKVVLTKESAEKWFGSENPMGKMLQLGNFEKKFEVTGIVENPPTNTHMKYSMLISEASYKMGKNDNWLQSRKYRFVYLKLKNNVSVSQLEGKLQAILYDKVEPAILAITGKNFKELLGSEPVPQLLLQPISEAYIESILDMEIGGVTGNKTLVFIAFLIAIAILVLACINFINLSTARFSNRMKEICIKKTVGAEKRSLLFQFFGEAYIITFVAIILALAITELTIGSFCDMLMLEYVISVYKLPYFIPFIISLFIVVGLLSGFYPALIMSNVNIVRGLKAGKNGNGKGSLLRKLLVVIQFGISFSILLGAIVITNQIGYMLDDDKGYERNNIVILHNLPDIEKEKQQTLKHEIEKLEGVRSCSFTNIYPTAYTQTLPLWKESDSSKAAVEFIMNPSDYSFIETMGISLIEGQMFQEDIRDTTNVLINETAKHILGLDNPVGTYLVGYSGNPEDPYFKAKIIGVVKDYNIEPVHNKIRPVFITMASRGYQNVLVKLTGVNRSETIEKINALWKEFSNGNNLSIEDMDDVINWLYRNELSSKTIINVFSIICILIASLGLIGLVSYSTLRRTKEIGIRKANGAKIIQIILLLSKETAFLIAIAIVVFVYPAIYFINLWLGMFAYHIDVSFAMVIAAILLVYIIAIICEVSLTLKAAKQNPVKSLRYE